MMTDREDWYWTYSGAAGSPDPEGLSQFRALQSSGKRPDIASDSCVSLSSGKRSWDITLAFIRWSYLRDGFWHGSTFLSADFGRSEVALRDIEKSLKKTKGWIPRMRKDVIDHRPRDGTWRPEGVTEENPYS